MNTKQILEKTYSFYPRDLTRPYRNDAPPRNWYEQTNEYHNLMTQIKKTHSNDSINLFAKCHDFLKDSGYDSEKLSTLMFPCLGLKVVVDRLENKTNITVREAYLYISNVLPFAIIFGTSFVYEKSCPFLLSKEGKMRSLVYPEIIIVNGMGIFKDVFSKFNETIKEFYPNHQLLSWSDAMVSASDRYISHVHDYRQRTLFNMLFTSAPYLFHRCIK